MRIGVNLGEVIFEGDDCYGEGVNIAARLEQIAEPGSIYVSGKVAKEVEKKLPFGFEAMGEQRVKNLAEPVAVYQVKTDGQPPRRLIKARHLRKRWSLPVGFAAAMAMADAAAFGVQGWWTSSGAAIDPMSVAVLPFDNLGEDPKWDRIADGITEDIITGSVTGPSPRHRTPLDQPLQGQGKQHTTGRGGVDVNIFSREVCRRSMIAFASPRDFGRHGYRRGSLVRALRSIDEDIFEVQSEVTAKIANTLASQSGIVRKAQFKLAKRKPPSSLSAYDTYLIADEMAFTPVGGITKDGLLEAENLFYKAIELDPQMARPYIGLSYVYSLMFGYGFALLLRRRYQSSWMPLKKPWNSIRATTRPTAPSGRPSHGMANLKKRSSSSTRLKPLHRTTQTLLR